MSISSGKEQEKGVTGLMEWGQAGPREMVLSLGEKMDLEQEESARSPHLSCCGIASA